MSTPSNEPASLPFSQWLVALIGCEAVLPSARATRARATVDVMLAAVPDTNAARRVLVQPHIRCSTADDRRAGDEAGKGHTGRLDSHALGRVHHEREQRVRKVLRAKLGRFAAW